MTKDGSRELIPLDEGFSRGCPASPVFAALVLECILSNVKRDIGQDAALRANAGDLGDDGIGGIPIILPYIDDINALVPLSQVKLFMDLFDKYGREYGAVLNREKMMIMTTTSGKSVVQCLLNSCSVGRQMLGMHSSSPPSTHTLT